MYLFTKTWKILIVFENVFIIKIIVNTITRCHVKHSNCSVTYSNVIKVNNYNYIPIFLDNFGLDLNKFIINY